MHEQTGSVLTILDSKVYDVTSFLDDHPGDAQLLIASAGCDATEAFDYIEHSSHARRILTTMAAPNLDSCAARSLNMRRQAQPRASAVGASAGVGGLWGGEWMGEGMWSEVQGHAHRYLRDLANLLGGRAGSMHRVQAMQLLRFWG